MFERQAFALNDSVRIEYIEWSAKETARSRASILLVPGFLATARDWAETPLVQHLLVDGFPRVAAISLRGRGNSDSPSSGWTLSHHLSDIGTVLDAIGCSDVHLIGHSVGASYCLAYALSRPERVLDLVLGDYPPIIPPFDADQARSHLKQLGRQVSTEFLEGMQRESEFINLAPQLGRIELPVLVIRGTNSEVMEQTDLAMFEKLPDKVIVEVQADHDVFEHPESARAVVSFLTHV